MTNNVVSFDDELLLVVNENDEVINYLTKAECHDDEGILHRAFSVFIFNEKGELLIQQRSKQKRLWSLTWSNSCCSHPRKGESMEIATQRRIEEELGFKTALEFLYKFQYQARYDATGSENEICYVYIGLVRSDDVRINPTEIAEWKFVSPQAMDRQLETNPDDFTPWFKMEWQRIRNDHWDQVKALTSDPSTVE